MFPTITHISQVTDAIDDSEFFNVVNKGDYTVINYLIQCEETFPSPFEEDISDDEVTRRHILRECRGLIFDTKGNIIRRPLHKFFNHGQIVSETKSYDDPHDVVIKYDGSMIVPFRIRDNIYYGTKMGYTEVSKPVMGFVQNNKKYDDLFEYLSENGYNPIYEWCSKQQQIVLEYPEDMLVLLEIRHIETGEYMDIDMVNSLAQKFNIPSVEVYGKVHNIDSFLEHVKYLKDQEGYIIRFHDGRREKVKADEYLALHRIVSECNSEKSVLKLIMDDSIDDVLPGLPDNLRDKVEDYSFNVMSNVIHIVNEIKTEVEELVTQCETRKDFAINVTNGDKKFLSFKFRVYDMVLSGETDMDDYIKAYFKCFENSLNKVNKIEENRHLIGNVEWKGPNVDID